MSVSCAGRVKRDEGHCETSGQDSKNTYFTRLKMHKHIKDFYSMINTLDRVESSDQDILDHQLQIFQAIAKSEDKKKHYTTSNIFFL